jgi:hypothetical protein
MFWNGITASDGLSGSGEPLGGKAEVSAETRATGAVNR